MDLDRVLADLIDERNLIDRAIASLERLSTLRKRAPVRPPPKIQAKSEPERVKGAASGYE